MTRPGMSDGRCFTSYSSNCELNRKMMKQHNITNNNEYRRFLQENGDSIIREQSKVCVTNANKECKYCLDTGK